MALSRRTFAHAFLALPAGSLVGRGQRSPVRGEATVRDGRELQAALRGAASGATIVLAAGDYGDAPGGEFRVEAPGVTLRAEAPLKAVLRDPLVVDGPGARLLDLAFRGEGEDGIFTSALAACADSLHIRSADVEVARCDFGFFGARAILVRPTGLRAHIHDCTFHDSRDGGGDKNVHEAVSLGYDAPTSVTSLRARVLNNRLWNLNVASESEAICVKTSDNVVQGNRIESSRAGYSNRGGERNLYQGNVSINGGGFLIEDRGNRLVGNTVSGTGSIKVLAGNAPASTTTSYLHPQADGTYLEGNTGTLVIGHVYTGLSPVLPAINTVVRSHNGSIQLKSHRDTTLP